jgi:hypothetical protein
MSDEPLWTSPEQDAQDGWRRVRFPSLVAARAVAMLLP